MNETQEKLCIWLTYLSDNLLFNQKQALQYTNSISVYPFLNDLLESILAQDFFHVSVLPVKNDVLRNYRQNRNERQAIECTI